MDGSARIISAWAGIGFSISPPRRGFPLISKHARGGGSGIVAAGFFGFVGRLWRFRSRLRDLDGKGHVE